MSCGKAGSRSCLTWGIPGHLETIGLGAVVNGNKVVSTFELVEWVEHEQQEHWEEQTELESSSEHSGHVVELEDEKQSELTLRSTLELDWIEHWTVSSWDELEALAIGATAHVGWISAKIGDKSLRRSVVKSSEAIGRLGDFIGSRFVGSGPHRRFPNQ